MARQQKQKTILCYGDSNTWGFVPGKMDYESYYMERYSREVRWTGLLQQALGDDYYIIEEGLNGRTTNVDYADFEGRNGKTYLAPCLYSQAPLDLIIISLGGNDLKVEFDRDAKAIAAGLEELVDLVQTSTFGSDMRSPPEILLAAFPVPTNESYLGLEGEPIFTGAIDKARALIPEVEQLAKAKGCYFINPAPHIHLSEIDGIHLDEQGHKVLARLMAEKVRAIF